MVKRLVVCLDGTWNSPDNGHATNVVKIMQAILPVDRQGVPQITFYDAGVGADGGRIDRVLDGITGRGLEQNVRDGYRFLAHNWLPGDQIYIFGFSRGAFTARSLCGFMDLVGLLPKRHIDRLGEAWALYQEPKDQRDDAKRRELRALSRPASVKCLGVWDTVGSRGVPGEMLQWANRKHQFHDAELSDLVECAFHALAIDERRGPFGPVLWQQPSGQSQKKPVEQVWFPGAHSNVGGGWAETGLADIALTWMIRRVQAHSDLAFDEDYIATQLRPDPLGPISDSRSLLYAPSRLWPFERRLGRHSTRGAWLGRLAPLLRRLDPRTNRPKAGCEFVNEMIHWSALERFDQRAPEAGRPRRYRPANLAAALAAGMLIADERLVPVPRHQSPASAPAQAGPRLGLSSIGAGALPKNPALRRQPRTLPAVGTRRRVPRSPVGSLSAP